MDLSENRKGRDHLEVRGIDVRIILKCISKKWSGSVKIEFIWLRIGTSGTKWTTRTHVEDVMSAHISVCFILETTEWVSITFVTLESALKVA
jgi:hypothetical protein